MNGYVADSFRQRADAAQRRDCPNGIVEMNYRNMRRIITHSIPWKKLTATFVVSSFAFVSSAMPQTGAYFYDTASVEKNVFSAGTLDIFAEWQDDGNFHIEEILPGGSETRFFRVDNEGSLNLRYRVSIDGANEEVCDVLEYSVFDGVYSGVLSEFAVPERSIVSGGDFDIWKLEISLPEDVSEDIQGGVCEFSFVIDAWQENLPDASTGFVDAETISGDSIRIGVWEEEEEEEESDESEFLGDVVINEIMWMGSRNEDGGSQGNDEWIELRNMTDEDIDITRWEIENAKSSHGSLVIEDDSDDSKTFTIPAEGYFLISRYDEGDSQISVDPDLVDSVSLANDYDDNGALVLKDAAGNAVDQTPEPDSGSWPKGENGDTRHSMERNDTPGDGTDGGDWHSCISDTCNDGIFWDSADGSNYGTPGAANHSENDPTANDDGARQSTFDEEQGGEENAGEEEIPSTEVGGDLKGNIELELVDDKGADEDVASNGGEESENQEENSTEENPGNEDSIVKESGVVEDDTEKEEEKEKEREGGGEIKILDEKNSENAKENDENFSDEKVDDEKSNDDAI
jgi:hypothetical protein